MVSRSKFRHRSPSTSNYPNKFTPSTAGRATELRMSHWITGSPISVYVAQGISDLGCATSLSFQRSNFAESRSLLGYRTARAGYVTAICVHKADEEPPLTVIRASLPQRSTISEKRHNGAAVGRVSEKQM